MAKSFQDEYKKVWAQRQSNGATQNSNQRQADDIYALMGGSSLVGSKTDKANNGNAKSVKKSEGKKNSSISIKALGAGDYGASKNTRADNVLRASGTSAAGAID